MFAGRGGGMFSTKHVTESETTVYLVYSVEPFEFKNLFILQTVQFCANRVCSKVSLQPRNILFTTPEMLTQVKIIVHIGLS